MKLNVAFKEGRSHAWLLADGRAELFIKRPLESLITTRGHLTCWVPSARVDEIRQDSDGISFDEGNDAIFLCCSSDNEMKLFYVEQAVTYSGGDVLLFIQPIAAFH